MSAGFAIDFGDKYPVSYWCMHTWFDTDLRFVSRDIGEPQRDDPAERIPYSSETVHYDNLAKMHSYGERTLTYKYEFLAFGGCRGRKEAQAVITGIKNALRWNGTLELHDELYSDYIFEVRQPEVSMEHPQNGVYLIALKFRAKPAMLPLQISGNLLNRLDDRKYPDIDGDGKVNGTEVSMILDAAELQAKLLPTGLTPEQEELADADRDGLITAADALLVQEYAAAVSAGVFADSPDSWFLHLQRYFRRLEAVY